MSVGDRVEGPPPGWLVWMSVLIGVVMIGVVDYLSGVQLRVFPLYYIPISFTAWHRGRAGALAAAALCALSWFVSNVQAGPQFTHASIWVANTMVQATSFAIVGLLIAILRASLVRERGLSRTDPLTTLLNTRAFLEEGNRTLALCRRHRRPVTIAYLDLDNFKGVNDGLGHQAGDDLLRRVAELIRGSIRLTDLAARLGGDEFVILLPEAGADEAGATLERLRSLLADTFAAIAAPVTVSVGAVSHLDAPDDLEQMVQQADACMYKAKGRGKNRLCLEVVGRNER